MAEQSKNNNEFDEILSSILDKSSSDNKESNRDGIISQPESYADVLKAYSSDTEAADFNDIELEESFEKTNVFASVEQENVPKAKNEVKVKAPKQPKPVKEKKKRRPRKNYSAYGGIVLATLVVCCSIIISLFGIVVGRDFLGIDGSTNEFTIYIPEGSSVDDIANQLYSEGVIDYVDFFKVVVKISDAGTMYPGDLDITGGMSYGDIINALTQMREAKATATVTFIEGTTLYDAALKLEEAGVCDAEDFIFTFNSTVYGYEFEKHVASSSLKFYKYEGYLFPDTYEFYLGDSTYNIVKKIKQRTAQILSADVIARAAEMGYTLDEVVTLASIIQLECGDANEMKNVSSVFLNRLNNPEQYPKLQSDTTVFYINNVIKKLSSIQYEEMYNAYDSYVCTGLPVGAICNPGSDAINAVLNANETPYYYFCANIQTGEMFYAQTYDEHLENCEAAGLDPEVYS